MNRRQFQAASEQARRRAVELGEAGDTAAVPELIGLCGHAGPTVRRAAASALGKLATDAAVRAAVPALCTLARDPHPQVRQYALLALGKIGDEAALSALRDAANCPTGPDYVLAAALKAVEQIEAAAKARREAAPVACARCGCDTSAEERRISESQFQRAYCAACFDAVFIERRNFDMKVQNQKTILSADRTVVQSRGERQIADWLAARGIPYRYDDKFQIIQGFAVRPDFYLLRYDVYIEFWGLDTTDYKIGMLLKQKLYQQEGKKLISLYPADLPHLNNKLGDALSNDVGQDAAAHRNLLRVPHVIAPLALRDAAGVLDVRQGARSPDHRAQRPRIHAAQGFPHGLRRRTTGCEARAVREEQSHRAKARIARHDLFDCLPVTGFRCGVQQRVNVLRKRRQRIDEAGDLLLHFVHRKVPRRIY